MADDNTDTTDLHTQQPNHGNVRSLSMASLEQDLKMQGAISTRRAIAFYRTIEVLVNCIALHRCFRRIYRMLLAGRIRRTAAVPSNQLDQHLTNAARYYASHTILALSAVLKNKLEVKGLPHLRDHMFGHYSPVFANRFPQFISDLIATFGVFEVRGRHYDRCLYYACMISGEANNFNIPPDEWVLDPTIGAQAVQALDTDRNLSMGAVNINLTSEDPWWLVESHIDNIAELMLLPAEMSDINNYYNHHNSVYSTYSMFEPSHLTPISRVASLLFTPNCFARSTIITRGPWSSAHNSLNWHTFAVTPNFNEDPDDASTSNLDRPEIRDEFEYRLAEDNEVERYVDIRNANLPQGTIHLQAANFNVHNSYNSVAAAQVGQRRARGGAQANAASQGLVIDRNIRFGVLSYIPHNVLIVTRRVRYYYDHRISEHFVQREMMALLANIGNPSD